MANFTIFSFINTNYDSNDDDDNNNESNTEFTIINIINHNYIDYKSYGNNDIIR